MFILSSLHILLVFLITKFGLAARINFEHQVNINVAANFWFRLYRLYGSAHQECYF